MNKKSLAEANYFLYVQCFLLLFFTLMAGILNLGGLIRLPVNGVLRFRASKTAKWAEFQVSESPVLSALVDRRLASKAHSVMLLTSATGRQVSERMLSDRWDAARSKAAKANPLIANQILSMFNRDLRKRAADLAGDLEAASKLLQHTSLKMTEAHYRTKPQQLKAVR